MPGTARLDGVVPASVRSASASAAARRSPSLLRRAREGRGNKRASEEGGDGFGGMWCDLERLWEDVRVPRRLDDSSGSDKLLAGGRRAEVDDEAEEADEPSNRRILNTGTGTGRVLNWGDGHAITGKMK